MATERRTGRKRVLLVRGHQANPWELRPWELLGDEYDVSYLATRRGWFDTAGLALHPRPARALRDLLPAGRAGDLAVRLVGDRYLQPKRTFSGADIVHAQELGYWYTAQAARLRSSLGYRLVVNTWETIPFLEAYRNIRTRPYRRQVLAAADLFLPATRRARLALLLEGAPDDRIRVAAPGVDLEAFRPASGPAAGAPLILSPGRLVWEKGHQDVLRAAAAIRRGLVGKASGREIRVAVVGVGPEKERLRAYARELGLEDAVEFLGARPYDQMPQLFRTAAAVVLASLPTPYWEEQFGMVLAEAIAAGCPVVASESGAIREVLGDAGRLFPSGDWAALAQALLEGPLAASTAGHRPERAALFSAEAAAERLREAYGWVLSLPPRL